MHRVARKIGNLDVALALADFAVKNDLCKPRVTEEEPANAPAVYMQRARNPFLEAEGQQANDVVLDATCKLTMLAGPNAAGKTTLLQTIALNLVLASAGSYVFAQLVFSPVQRLVVVASEATIGT